MAEQEDTPHQNKVAEFRRQLAAQQANRAKSSEQILAELNETTRLIISKYQDPEFVRSHFPRAAIPSYYRPHHIVQPAEVAQGYRNAARDLRNGERNAQNVIDMLTVLIWVEWPHYIGHADPGVSRQSSKTPKGAPEYALDSAPDNAILNQLVKIISVRYSESIEIIDYREMAARMLEETANLAELPEVRQAFIEALLSSISIGNEENSWGPVVIDEKVKDSDAESSIAPNDPNSDALRLLRSTGPVYLGERSSERFQTNTNNVLKVVSNIWERVARDDPPVSDAEARTVPRATSSVLLGDIQREIGRERTQAQAFTVMRDITTFISQLGGIEYTFNPVFWKSIESYLMNAINIRGTVNFWTPDQTNPENDWNLLAIQSLRHIQEAVRIMCQGLVTDGHLTVFTHFIINLRVLGKHVKEGVDNTVIAQLRRGPSPAVHHCEFCFEDIPQGYGVTFLPCGHWFHSRCIPSWLRQRGHCPTRWCQLGLTPCLNLDLRVREAILDHRGLDVDDTLYDWPKQVKHRAEEEVEGPASRIRRFEERVAEPQFERRPPGFQTRRRDFFRESLRRIIRRR